MKSIIFITVIAAVPATCVLSADTSIMLEPAFLPALPNVDFGLSGSFIGTHDDVLIVAGGTNFPEKPPWHGGEKIPYTNIYILRKTETGQFQWFTAKEEMPAPVAYGASISLPDGLLCVGGDGESGVSKEALLVQWNVDSQDIEILPFPAMPEPLAYCSCAVIGSTVYVCGGKTNGKPATTRFVFSLDIKDRQKGWQRHAPWPGRARMFCMSAGLIKDGVEQLFLFGGCDYSPDGIVEVLVDGFRLDPATGTWEEISRMPGPRAGAASIIFSENILVFGGDNGEEAQKRIVLKKTIDALKKENKTDQAATLESDYITLFENHPGFSNEILGYDPVADNWVIVAKHLPFPVTTTAAWFAGKIVIPGGETSPGRRTSKVLALKVKKNN